MTSNQTSRVTQILGEIKAGDRSALEKLLPLVYDELRELAASHLKRERKNHTLQPTALVHEAYLKLMDQSRVDWQGRTHFFAVGAQAMRRILVDHARHRRAAKRGGGRLRITFDEELIAGPQQDEDILAVDDALVKLTRLDPQHGRMVELRFFGGLTVAEVAESLEMSKRSVEREWTMVRAWLRRELSEADTS
jgi:RNA polymerase sigma-70 factor (ECF subfamily)